MTVQALDGVRDGVALPAEGAIVDRGRVASSWRGPTMCEANL